MMKELIFFSIITTWTPGPNPITCMSNANQYGFKKTIPFMLGIYPAFTLVMIFCVFFSNIIYQIQSLQIILKVLGMSYMFFLAYRMIQRKEFVEVETKGLGFKEGFLLQFVNIKIMIYGITAATTFILPYYHQKIQLILCAILLSSIPMMANLLWSFFGAFLKEVFDRRRNVINMIMAILLVYAGLKMIRQNAL